MRWPAVAHPGKGQGRLHAYVLGRISEKREYRFHAPLRDATGKRGRRGPADEGIRVPAVAFQVIQRAFAADPDNSFEGVLPHFPVAQEFGQGR